MNQWRKPSRDTLERVSKALFVIGVSLGSAALVVGPGLLAARERQMMATSPALGTPIAVQPVSSPLTSLMAGNSLRQPVLEIKLPAPKAVRKPASRPVLKPVLKKPVVSKPVAIAPKTIKTTARAERFRPAPKLEQTSTPTRPPVLARKPVRQTVNANGAARTNARASTRQVRAAPLVAVKPTRSVSRARSVAASSMARSSRVSQITRTTTRQPITTVTPEPQSTSQSTPQSAQAVTPERATAAPVIVDRLENTVTETQPSSQANPATAPGRQNEPDSPAERLADRIFER